MNYPRRISFAIFGGLALYAAAYVAYRNYGPASYYWMRNSKHPGVLCRTESRSDVFLYHFFHPCIDMEDAFYRLKYRNVQHTLDEWNAISSAEGVSQ